MKINELITQLDRPMLSFEAFPPRDPAVEKRLAKALPRLIEAKPDFFAVTFGAGGSTREGSFELAQQLVKMGQNVLTYIAGYGMTQKDVEAVVERYYSLGIRNVLCVRGDAPEGSPDSTVCRGEFPHATDLLRFIRGLNADICLGAAAYPEGHHESSGIETDIVYCKEKVEEGADFLITQYCYDLNRFHRFKELCNQKGIPVPILAGIMPVYSVSLTENLAGSCGATLPEDFRKSLAGLPPDNPDAITQFGIDFAFEQAKALQDEGVAGLHFYTMNRSKSVVEIVSKLRNI